MGNILNGKELAEQIKIELKEIIEEQKINPSLMILQVGENYGSEIYIRNKRKACEEIGIKSLLGKFNNEESLGTFLTSIKKPKLSTMIQLPIADCKNEQECLDKINPLCDPDCLTSLNLGKLFNNQNRIAPCTAQGIIHLLKYYNIPIVGKNVVIVGRSNIVGKPVAHLFLKENATVTICHSKTEHLEEYTKQADILVVAIGKAKFIKKSMVKPHSVVIDVGINRSDEGKLCGDVDFEAVQPIVDWISPVPRGVGAMTVVELLINTICLYGYNGLTADSLFQEIIERIEKKNENA